MSSDIVIVGAGCMGASTAYHLVQRDPSLQVTVYDRDLSLARASTLLSDGNVRIQFNLEENILISRYAMEVLERFGDEMAVGDFRPDVGMKKQGNLFFVDEDSQEAARQGLELQRSLGCNVEWLDMHAVTERWPVLASDRFVGGTFGSDDGAVDPNAVTSGYRRAAEARGARFVQAEVASLTTSGERVGGVVLADGTVHSASPVVGCGGDWSTSLLATAGVEIPVEPVMRTVYVVRSDVAGGQMLPSFFLPSGLYVISENPDTCFIAWSLPDDRSVFTSHPPTGPLLRDHLAALVEAIPALDRSEVVRSWAGLYEQNTLDANGIIGEWPGITGLYQATGFSGHGFQQCHAVGRYLAESIIGQEPFLDLSRLGPERIVENRPVFEHAGRII